MFYSNNTIIHNLRCTVSPVGGLGSGKFRALFERELASLEQIEAIPWSAPQISGDTSLLPEAATRWMASLMTTVPAPTRSYSV